MRSPEMSSGWSVTAKQIRSLRYSLKVLRIHARAIAANMVNLPAFRYGADEKLVSESVGVEQPLPAPARPDAPIPLWVFRARPIPARGSL